MFWSTMVPVLHRGRKVCHLANVLVLGVLGLREHGVGDFARLRDVQGAMKSPSM